jgi:hypothetical protein
MDNSITYNQQYGNVKKIIIAGVTNLTSKIEMLHNRVILKVSTM